MAESGEVVCGEVTAKVGPAHCTLNPPRVLDGGREWDGSYGEDLELPWAWLATCPIRFTFPGGAVVTKRVKAKYTYPSVLDECSELDSLDYELGLDFVAEEVLRLIRRHGISHPGKLEVRTDFAAPSRSVLVPEDPAGGES